MVRTPIKFREHLIKSKQNHLKTPAIIKQPLARYLKKTWKPNKQIIENQVSISIEL